MADIYHQIRVLHFRSHLTSVLDTLRKVALALLAILGPGLPLLLVFAIVGLSKVLLWLVDPTRDAGERLLVAVAWQFSTLVVLWPLRKMIFVLDAESFFDTLPVSRWRRLRADLGLTALSYSIFWLPVGWFITAQRNQPQGPLEGFMACTTLASLVLTGFAANLLILRRRAREGAVASACLALVALPEPGGVLETLGAIAAPALGAWILWRTYDGPRAVHTTPRPVVRLMDRASIATGLVLHFLAHELRVDVLVRAAVLFGSLLVASLLTSRAANETAAETFVALAAIGPLALFRLPERCRHCVLSRLECYAGRRSFRQRVALAAYLVPSLWFALFMLVAYVCMQMHTTAEFPFRAAAWRAVLVFSGSYAVGILAARAGIHAANWLLPLTNLTVALLMTGFI